MKRFAGLLFAALLTLSPQAPARAEEAGLRARLEAISKGDHRDPANVARDAYRHPVETLLFFGIRPDMTVVEVWPGGGWYTEFLAPLLKDKGKYYAAHLNRDTKEERILKGIAKFDAKLAARPDQYGAVVVTELSPSKSEMAPAGSADLVLTFRNVHNWMKFGFQTRMFEAMNKALKPGGLLGVVEHRADPEDFPEPQALSGYVHEEQVIEMAKRAGFELVAKSEINANPKDSRHHPEGVWTLPPVLRLKDVDRARYEAIGESDRMTLLFKKSGG